MFAYDSYSVVRVLAALKFVKRSIRTSVAMKLQQKHSENRAWQISAFASIDCEDTYRYQSRGKEGGKK